MLHVFNEYIFRWFGKSVHAVVGKFGYIGITSTDYGGDGKVFFRFGGEIITHMLQTTLLKDESRDFTRSSISRLDFNLDSNLVSKVNEAKMKFVLLRSDMPFQQVICDDFDYALIKKRKLSPDFIVKLTAQVIYL